MNVDARTHWAKTNIDLDLFAEKIKVYLDVQIEISEFKTTHEVGTLIWFDLFGLIKLIRFFDFIYLFIYLFIFIC